MVWRMRRAFSLGFKKPLERFAMCCHIMTQRIKERHFLVNNNWTVRANARYMWRSFQTGDNSSCRLLGRLNRPWMLRARSILHLHKVQFMASHKPPSESTRAFSFLQILSSLWIAGKERTKYRLTAWFICVPPLTLDQHRDGSFTHSKRSLIPILIIN